MPWIVYETTNLKNGKKYIGVHKQDGNGFDGYLGSGKALNAAIRKYGRTFFERRTLEVFQSEMEAYASEAEIVTEEWCKRKDSYNQKPGGMGGFPVTNPELVKVHSDAMRESWCDPEIRKKRSDGIRVAWSSEKTREKHSAAVKESWQIPGYRERRHASLTAAFRTPEAIKNRSNATRKLWGQAEYREKMKKSRLSRRLSKATAMLVVIQDANVSQTA